MRAVSKPNGLVGRAWRTRLLGSTSLLCLTLAIGNPVQAADALVKKAPESFYERFNITIEGGYLWNSSPANLQFGTGAFDVLDPLRPGRGGGMAGISVGRAVDQTWDWRVGWQGNFLGTNSSSGIAPNTLSSTNVAASNKLWFQTFDADIGYRITPNAPVRWFLGARVLNANNTLEYADDGSGKLGNFAHRTNLWGAGPRAGAEATVPLPNSPAFLTMTGAASAIFAHRDHDFIFDFNNGAPATAASGSGTTSFSRNVTVYNLEGSIAVGYRVTNQATLQIGYRVQQWWNIVPNISGATVTSSLNAVGNGNALVHGPFGRLTVAWP